MGIIENENKIAIVIAIEHYIKPPSGHSLPQVQHAIDDALLMKKVFIENMGIDPSNIYEYTNEQATKTTLENEIPYYLGNLREDDTLYFYYAGHGCFSNGANRITAYDSNSFNISVTTISLDNLIFKPLLKSLCKKSLIFLDSCSENIKEIVVSRGIIDSLSVDEFKKFTALNQYSGVFCSSSPGEKSYHSDILKNGIWTWHLANALSGNEPDAIERDNIITNYSLQNYLSHAVPKYITEKKEIIASQNPYAIFHSANTFSILELPATEDEGGHDFELNYSDAKLVNLENFSIRSASWFEKRKGHFVPDYYNSNTSSFIQGKEFENIKKEIQEIYSNTKKILNLRRKEIVKIVSEEGGTIDNKFFRYKVIVDQDSDDPSQYFFYRTLKLRKALVHYPTDFDDIFSHKFNEILFSYTGELDFDDLVDKFEDYKEESGGNLIDDEEENIIEYTFSNGLKLSVDFDSNSISFFPNSRFGCISLLESFSEKFMELGGIKKYLLE